MLEAGPISESWARACARMGFHFFCLSVSSCFVRRAEERLALTAGVFAHLPLQLNLFSAADVSTRIRQALTATSCISVDDATAFCGIADLEATAGHLLGELEIPTLTMNALSRRPTAASQSNVSGFAEVLMSRSPHACTSMTSGVMALTPPVCGILET